MGHNRFCNQHEFDKCRREHEGFDCKDKREHHCKKDCLEYKTCISGNCISIKCDEDSYKLSIDIDKKCKKKSDNKKDDKRDDKKKSD